VVDHISYKQFDKARRLYELLDEKPEMWAVYGETVRAITDQAQRAIEQLQVSKLKLLGTGNERQTTIRNLQMKWKRHLWNSRPRICTLCGVELTWATHRIHHIIPVKDGGEFSEENLTVVCVNCHMGTHEK